MIQTYQAVAFDVDGLLLDTEIFQFKGWQAVCASRLNHTLTEEEYQKHYVGQSSSVIAQKLVHAYNQAVNEHDLLKQREAVVKQLIETEPLNQMHYADEAIKFFGNNGVPIAFATGATKPESDVKLKRSGLARLVQIYHIPVITRDMVPEGKPSPDTYLRAAKDLGITDNSKILSFEDTIPGFQSASAAGTICFPVVNKWTEESFPKTIKTYANLEQALQTVKKDYSFFQPNRS